VHAILSGPKMSDQSEQSTQIEQLWRSYLTTGEFQKEERQRRLFRHLPGSPRCKNCYAPFRGLGSPVVRTFWGKRPSNLNTRLCNVCEEFAREYQGGAEIELSLLFGDVRGSTTLAEKMSPTEFGQLINRFYKVSSKIMVDTDALIDKIIGDQVSGIYTPGFAGPQHALGAVAAAQHLLKATGHCGAGEPWIPIGIGVHTGVSFMGSVGAKDGTIDITVLGDVPNTAARLSSTARAGEILISEHAFRSAGFQPGSLEAKVVELKGKTEGVRVYSLIDGSLPPMSDEGPRLG